MPLTVTILRPRHDLDHRMFGENNLWGFAEFSDGKIFRFRWATIVGVANFRSEHHNDEGVTLWRSLEDVGSDLDAFARSRQTFVCSPKRAEVLAAAIPALVVSAKADAIRAAELAEQQRKEQAAQIDRERAAWVRDRLVEFLQQEETAYRNDGCTAKADRVNQAAALANELGDDSLLRLDRILHGIA